MLSSQKNIPTYIAIYEDIYSKIVNEQWKEGDQLPPEMELCKQYFCSRITVQKALQKLVDKGLIVRISGKGTFVSIGKKKRVKSAGKVGLILCDFGISYGLDIIRSIVDELEKNGKSVVIKNSHFDKQAEADAIVDLLQLDVEGIIIQPIHNEFICNEILKLSLNQFPVVLFDRDLKGLSLPFVGTDNAAAVETVMNHLFSKGHRNICFMSSDTRNTSTLEERIDAFRRSYVAHDLLNTSSNTFTDILSPVSKPTQELVREDIERIKQHIIANPQQTCIFAGEYSVCLLVKQALKELKMRVKEDISLVTFDNIADPFFFTSTAYLKQNEKAIGKRAVELLLRRVEGEVFETKLYLSADFIENRSIRTMNAELGE